MNQTRLLKKLEGFRKRNSTNPKFINKDIYRLLYDEDIYIIAYNAIKSNHGAETKGADGTSLDGFCMEWVYEIISNLRNESYNPLPNKTQLIPKKNGKMRKLGFPNGKDKLLQEAVKIILECIYEPTFSDYSHGFRPQRSTHTAMAQIENWRGTSWFIEGDISACFDEIDHRILEAILREVGCINFYKCARIQYIVQFSVAKTLARKYDISLKKVFTKFGSSIRVDYLNENNKERRTQLALYPNFKRRRNYFHTMLTASKTPFTPIYNPRNPTKQPCTLCKSINNICMLHRKPVNLISRPSKPIIEHMIQINRRQIPVCKLCYNLL